MFYNSYFQLIVGLSPLLAALSVGGAVSYPTVLLHQLKAKDSPIQLDFNTASWIGKGVPSHHWRNGFPQLMLKAVFC